MTIASPDTDQACAPTASCRSGVSDDQADAAEQTPQVENGTAHPARPHWDFWIVVGATLIVAAVCVFYERLGTYANADQVVSFESFGDDAVVIGLTDEQPEHGPLPQTIEQRTGRGRQLYFRYPDGPTIRNKTALRPDASLEPPLALRPDAPGTVSLPADRHPFPHRPWRPAPIRPSPPETLPRT